MKKSLDIQLKFNDCFTSVFTQEDLSLLPKINNPNISASEEVVVNLLYN